MKSFGLLFVAWSVAACFAQAIHPGLEAPDSDERFRSIVKVETYSGAYGSGVFVNSSTLLSVGHVTDFHFPGGNVHVGGIPAVNVFSFPAFYQQSSPGGNPSPYDISVIVFPDGTAEKLGIQKFHPIATRPPKFDERLMLVGFAGGTRKYGGNTFLYQDEQFLYVLGHAPGHGKPGEHVITEGGDSGSPLLNAQGEIIGITAWNWWVPNDAVPARLCVFTKILKPAVHHLFEDAIQCRAPRFANEVRPLDPNGPCAQPFAH